MKYSEFQSAMKAAGYEAKATPDEVMVVTSYGLPITVIDMSTNGVYSLKTSNDHRIELAAVNAIMEFAYTPWYERDVPESELQSSAKPDLTQEEWQAVHEVVDQYADEAKTPAVVLDEAINDLLNAAIDDGPFLEKPGEMYEGIKWVLG